MPLPLLIEMESLGELAGVAEVEKVAGRLLPDVPVPLNSTAIESASYNMTEQLLTLHMRDGTTIEYYDIPLPTFVGLIGAPSPGGFYNRVIRRGFRSMQRV
jgi:hypothetical protein